MSKHKEYFTLTQVANRMAKLNTHGRADEVHILLNAAISELLGKPQAYIVSRAMAADTLEWNKSEHAANTPLYKRRKIKL